MPTVDDRLEADGDGPLARYLRVELVDDLERLRRSSLEIGEPAGILPEVLAVVEN